MNRFVGNLFRSLGMPALVGFVLVSAGASLSQAETRLVKKKPAPQPSLVKTAAAVSTLNKVALNPQPLPPGGQIPPWAIPARVRVGIGGFYPRAVRRNLSLLATVWPSRSFSRTIETFW